MHAPSLNRKLWWFSTTFIQDIFLLSVPKIGPETVFICDTCLCQPSWKMAAVAVRGPIHDGPISKFVHNILVYLCAKFDAFMIKCTIGLISCSTNTEIHRNRKFWSMWGNSEMEWWDDSYQSWQKQVWYIKLKVLVLNFHPGTQNIASC